MTTDNKIQFRLTLRRADWEDLTSGWRCSALRIPTAEVETVWSAGEVVDSARYRVEPGQQLLRWTAQPVPNEIVVGIAVSGSLPTAERLERLEKSKVKWAFAATIGGALIGATATALVALVGQSKLPPANNSTTAATSISTTAGAAQSNSSLSAPTPSSSTPSPRRFLCPDPPPPDVKLSTEPYIVEVAQATSQEVPFHEVNKVALAAADKLGDRWKTHLVASPGEKAYRRVDETQRSVYVARWYGLSRSAATGMCCYLDEHDWNGEIGPIKKHCIPERAPISKPAKATSSATGG